MAYASKSLRAFWAGDQSLFATPRAVRGELRCMRIEPLTSTLPLQRSDKPLDVGTAYGGRLLFGLHVDDVKFESVFLDNRCIADARSVPRRSARVFIR
jgi:hypothetical protein